ncbi:nuclear transport factor 2 family protein [Sphingosinicella microcystinivorans]|uniref:nuclear transport factor 2 family protein n=1 Tax=Sphingosinicella microcystinivorans TaxID=335406 RepID=UPI0022F3DCCF|nr:nuclear transport factor 2 family protein [Sphingosinicella microcystinivorans]WBX85774.1 nuclear transport factor 2 family protein [Sphingosinicella microcystinivorans]
MFGARRSGVPVAAILACTIGVVQLQSVIAKADPLGEAWRKRTLEAYDNAKPTAELVAMSETDKLKEIEEIQKLPLKYTRYINQRDWDRWVNLFTDESSYWQYTIGRVVSGPEGWREHLNAVGMTSEKMYSLFENFGHPEIELLSPTTARGVWQALFVFWMPRDETPTKGFLVEPGQESRTYAIYYQTYRKVNGTWKINTNIPTTVRHELGILPEGVTAPKPELPPSATHTKAGG